MKRTAMKRSRKRIPPRSERRQEELPERIEFVRRMTAERWRCEVGLPGCAVESCDVNELMRGSHVLGGYLDETKVETACRRCHDAVTAHPDWAYRHGHQVTHQATPADYRLAAAIRLAQRCTLDCNVDHRESGSNA
jgi:hypothetical protein